MAFLKRKRIERGTYLYVVRSYRTSEGRVRDQMLQYLGSEGKVPRADAVAFWNKWVNQRKTRKGAQP